MNQKEIATRVRELREERRHSQEALSEALGIRQPAYSELERGHTKLTAERALVLAEFYGISVDELLRGERGAARMML